jgi:predicted dienelactone hydrolase
MSSQACFVAILAISAAAAACNRDSSLSPVPNQGPVGRAVRTWVDESRPSWTGTGSRPLSVQVWYPTSDNAVEHDWVVGPSSAPLFMAGHSAENAALPSTQVKHSLVILSHGTGGSSVMLAWLGEALARNGYVAAAVNHHGNTSTESVPTPEGFMLWWERPMDLSKVLDHLLADPMFGSLIDVGRVGAAGFSLGGYTVTAVAGARTSLAQWRRFCESAQHDSTCDPQPEYLDAFADFEKVRGHPFVQTSLARHGDSYQDKRFKAIYAMAPVGSWLTSASLATVAVPVRVVVGDQDRTAPTPANARRIAELVPGAQLSVLRGVGHYTFLAECLPAGVSGLPSLCHEDVGVDRAAVHREVSADAVAFFDRSLSIHGERPGT